MAERQPLHYEALSVLFDRWMSISIYPEAGGGLSCYLQDITARKQAEAEREKLLAELSRSNEDLSQFSSVVSHDLQTPLRMVKSYAQLLERRCGGKLDATCQEFLRFVLDGTETMEALIRGLLAYAQMAEADHRKTAVSLVSVVEGVLATLQDLIQETGATVTHDPLPTLTGDPVQFLQLFQNLIGNALKYRRAGAAPVVHISVVQKKKEWPFFRL
jgi:light-regulated signal transduction histidine kinase (bacteriophytochrome)